MENVTTNVKIVGELPFQRLVNFFLWNIDEKAEHDFNVIKSRTQQNIKSLVLKMEKKLTP